MIEARRPACSLHFVNPHGLYDPSPNAYSHVAVATAPARIVFASGQGGEDRHGTLAPDFAAQVRRALENLEIALHAGGADVRDVAKLTVLIVDHSQERLQEFGAELWRMWGTRAPP
ncbi:RidA family protein, partial [Acinetobacter baumannii]